MNNVPDLGQIGRQPQQVRAGVMPMALVRELDENGTMAGLIVRDAQGNPSIQAMPGSVIDAETLVDMIGELLDAKIAALRAHLDQKYRGKT